MVSESIAHLAFGLMGYWLRARGIIVKYIQFLLATTHSILNTLVTSFYIFITSEEGLC